MIEIKELSKDFGSVCVLREISLSFAPGMVYGVVGENGAGKTTLFRCIYGLESYSGHIGFSPEDLRNRIGYLPTEPYLLSRITGEEYVRLICKAGGVLKPKPQEHNIFELPLERYAEYYSSGMKKKLALMAILMADNEIFILDEPYNGVDIQSNLLITEIIRKLKELGKTVIISSHIFSTLTDTCDQLLHLSDGKIDVCTDKALFIEIEDKMRREGIGTAVEKMFSL